MERLKTKFGFTLIELLVVITIIGILATWAVSVYTSQIQRARDSTRVTSIKSLQTWVEQFYQSEYIYPKWWEDWSWSGWVQLYIPKLTQDPKHDQTCINSRCWYIYAVWSDANWITQWAYELSTAFENKWNVDEKANNNIDNGNDTNRLELWVPSQSPLDTSQAQLTPFSKTPLDVTDTSTVIVIANWWAIQK